MIVDLVYCARHRRIVKLELAIWDATLQAYVCKACLWGSPQAVQFVCGKAKR